MPALVRSIESHTRRALVVRLRCLTTQELLLLAAASVADRAHGLGIHTNPGPLASAISEELDARRPQGGNPA